MNTKLVKVVLLLAMFVAVAEANIFKDRVEVDKAEIIQYCISAVGIILGLVVAFFGYRLFKPVLFLTGFILGSGFTYLVLFSHTQVGIAVLVVAPIIAGIILGVVLLFLWIVGVFFLGSSFGFVLVSILYSSHDQGLIKNEIAWYVILAAIPFICGVIALIFQKPLIVLSTSLLGSYAVIAGVDRYVHGGFSQVIPFIVGKQKEFIDADYKTYIEIGACVLLALIAIIVQYRKTSKNVYHSAKEAEKHSDGYYALDDYKY